jgi:beta-lactamase regulating signal transducer with metallopeptidase domain
MALSYSLRLLCLIVCSVGLVSIAAEMMLWIVAPLILRLTVGVSARGQELVFCVVQMLPIFCAGGLTGVGLVPNYVIHETNFASERVGWLCLALAFAIVVWFARALVRGVHLLLDTARFARECRMSGEGLPSAQEEISIIAMRGTTDRLALVGLLNPFILISSSLLALDPLALEVALDHERAHARRKDNWKMLLLYALPSLNVRLRDGKTWMQHWRNATECAADHEAVRGEKTRALLLAETLVAVGRHARTENVAVVSTALVCGETDLVARVQRLIQPAAEGQLHDPNDVLLLCSTLLGGAIALVILLPVLADMPEHLLHLG